MNQVIGHSAQTTETARYGIWAFLLIVGISLVTIIGLIYDYRLSEGWTERGARADYWSGHLGTAGSLAGLVFIVIALRLQTRELELQREELRHSIETAREQNEQVRKQNAISQSVAALERYFIVLGEAQSLEGELRQLREKQKTSSEPKAAENAVKAGESRVNAAKALAFRLLNSSEVEAEERNLLIEMSNR